MTHVIEGKRMKRLLAIIAMAVFALVAPSQAAYASQGQHVEAWPIVGTAYCGFQYITAVNGGPGNQDFHAVTDVFRNAGCATPYNLPAGYLSTQVTVECLNPAPLSDILVAYKSPVVGNLAATSYAVIDRQNRNYCTKAQRLRVTLRSGYYVFGWNYYTIKTGWLSGT